MKNYYEILNIDINASKADIKKAYRILAVKYHPDKNNGDKILTQKFIEVKEAYDTLINPATRQTYDIKYKSYFNNYQNIKKKKNDFDIDNSNERTDDFTPQYRPAFNLFGNKIADNVEFFKFPKNIGIIIGAYSDLRKNEKPLTKEQKKRNSLIGFIVGIIIYALIYFYGEPNTTWTIIWLIVVLIIISSSVLSINSFDKKNYFVGTNGFAQFEMSEDRNNLTKDIEINFKNITDLFVKYTVIKKNFEYQKTKFEFRFINNGKEIFSIKDNFDKNSPKSLHPIELYFGKRIEHSWTIYLLENMESILEKEGYISFSIYRYGQTKKYIKLGINKIVFIRKNKEFTYNYDDIKNVYSIGNDLYIEHNNFNRKFYFIKSGDADKIPLLDLCNREFFFKTFEILLGYKL